MAGGRDEGIAAHGAVQTLQPGTVFGQGTSLDLHELEAGALRQVDHAVGTQHHWITGLPRGQGARHTAAHTHRQCRAVEQLLIVALAAEVVEVLVSQPQVGQFSLTERSAMADIPDGRQLPGTPPGRCHSHPHH